jgi:cytochrome oxidase assembly protein ShyY1
VSAPSSLRDWLRPGVAGLTLLAVAALVFCVLMGRWQIGVYTDEQDEARADRQAAAAVPLTELWQPGEAFHDDLADRSVTVEGTFTGDQWWVEGKGQGGRDGFWLLSTLRVAGQDAALAVVRGWAPQVGELPPAPSGAVTLDALLEPSDSTEYSEREVDGVPVIASVRIAALLNELDYPLYSGYALNRTPALAAGLDLAEGPDADVSWTTGLQNLSYAWQWWAFAAFVVFMWWRMSRDVVASHRARREESGPTGPAEEREVVA